LNAGLSAFNLSTVRSMQQSVHRTMPSRSRMKQARSCCTCRSPRSSSEILDGSAGAAVTSPPQGCQEAWGHRTLRPRNALHRGHQRGIHIVLGFQSATARQGPQISRLAVPYRPSGEPAGHSAGSGPHVPRTAGPCVDSMRRKKWTRAGKAAQSPQLSDSVHWSDRDHRRGVR
jgi:hypothetical protein